jgi:hypothetical protein
MWQAIAVDMLDLHTKMTKTNYVEHVFMLCPLNHNYPTPKNPQLVQQHCMMFSPPYNANTCPPSRWFA